MNASCIGTMMRRPTVLLAIAAAVVLATAVVPVRARPAHKRALADYRTYAWHPFERVVRPNLPAVQPSSRLRSPIDAWTAASQESRGLPPRPEASRPVLLRRAYLDLIGLPPEPEDLHAFLTDESPDAYEKLVDRLLASPQYGERWGRHWMDVWRRR